MEIVLDRVAVDGRHGPMLTPTSLTLRSGERMLVVGEPGHGHTALALAATGRLRASSGTVALDGSSTAILRVERALREATAVVDVPGISEPYEALPLSTLVAEELGFAGRRSYPKDVTAWLVAHDLLADAPRRVERLPALVRTTVLAELAAERPGIGALVLVLPDRHGGHPREWWALAGTLARRGLAVLVQCTPAAAGLLGVVPVAPGPDPAHEPLRVTLHELVRSPAPEPAPVTA
ncbi:MAG: ATP-binding cassette domain-containing protein [Cellulomonas sp.]